MSGRVVFHVDANSAYLSWEAVWQLMHGAKLDLRTVPSVVAGDPSSRHGIILTKSIPAKAFKIETGESLFIAKSKCPELIVVKPRYDFYMKISNCMVKILNEYSPLIERYSIDECFLEYTGMEKLFGDPVEAAHMLKERIKEELGFTVNVGVARNKLLAKMASELKKPDNVHTLWPEEIEDKMWPLPIEELFMVGRATAPKLRKAGIETIGALANADPALIRWLVKNKFGEMLCQHARGEDYSQFRTGRRVAMKGIGNSMTTPIDVVDARTAKLYLMSLAETVTARLRAAECFCRCVTISIRSGDFGHASRQCMLDIPTDSTEAIYHACWRLFDELWNQSPLRHLGIRVTEISSNSISQLNLLSYEDFDRQEKLDKTIDDIRERFGARSIYRAAFLGGDIKPMSGGVGDVEDYPMMSSLL